MAPRSADRSVPWDSCAREGAWQCAALSAPPRPHDRSRAEQYIFYSTDGITWPSSITPISFHHFRAACAPLVSNAGAHGEGWHSEGWHGQGWHSEGWHSEGWHSEGWHGQGRHSEGWHSEGWHGQGWHSEGWHGETYLAPDDAADLR